MPENFRVFSHALRELLHRPDSRQRFMERETSKEIQSRLGITDEMAVELKMVLSKMPVGGDADAAGTIVKEAEGEARELKDQVKDAMSFLNQSLNQLRFGVRILIAMSVTIFLLGVAFLVIAAVRSFTNPDSAQITAVIAGVGVAQILILFYRNPLRDISQAISNSQQARMVVMSYMLGVTLVAKSLTGAETEREQQALSQLTQQALKQLEQFAEGKLEQVEQARTLPRPPGPPADAA